MVMQVYGLGTKVGIALPYSRTQESEAGHVAMLYMAPAGYDPRQAVAFWQRFAEYGRKCGGKRLEFLSPPSRQYKNCRAQASDARGPAGV